MARKKKPKQKADESTVHPVLRREKYTMPTPATEAALQVALDLLKDGFSGALFYGPFRGGKSQSIEYLRDNISGEYGSAVSTFVLEVSPGIGTRNQHYRWMATELGHSLANSAKDPEAQAHYLLLSDIKRAKAKDVIVAFDEAQSLTSAQWVFILRTHNWLKKHLPSPPLFLFFGQDELKNQRNYKLGSDQQNIVGRFMLHEHVIGSIRSVVEFKYWLGLFDDPDHGWPTNSGLSFTQYFFPKAYPRGFRLANLAEEWWRIIGEQLTKNGLGTLRTLRTQYFFFMVEALFKLYGNAEVVKPDIGETELVKAIHRSRYLESVRMSTTAGAGSKKR